METGRREDSQWWEREGHSLTRVAGHRVDCVDEQWCVALRVFHKHQQQLQGCLHHQTGLGGGVSTYEFGLSQTYANSWCGQGRTPRAGPREESLGRKTLVPRPGVEVSSRLRGATDLLHSSLLFRRRN